MTVTTLDGPVSRKIGGSEAKLIFASSLGTVFEWYDFYLYGSLATIISKQFFSGVNETAGFIFALLAFAAGFAVRPFGALIFGRLGDMVGRKYTFLVTIVIMGLSTFVVGLLPTYQRSAWRRQRCSSRCGFSRVSRSEANTAERRRTSRSIRQRQTWPVYLLDPDDGDARILPFAARDPRRPARDRRNRVRGLGLARSVPDVDRAARRLGLDPIVAHRVRRCSKR